MMSSVATRGFATSYASAASVTCWASLAPPRCATYKPRCPSTPGVDGAAQISLASGHRLAHVARSNGLDTLDSARRRERTSGHRDGQTPGADADGAQAHRTSGVA